MRYLRRQWGPAEPPAAPAADVAPAPPAVVPSPTPARRAASPVAGERTLAPLRQRLAPAARQAGVVSADEPAPGYDLLRFAERRENRFAVVTAPDARREILRLHAEIDQINRHRRRLREDRDRWQRLARELEAELLAVRNGEPHPNGNPLAAADKFRRAKMVLARLTHPDSSGASGPEADIRAAVFQEFWSEFERIEAEHTRRQPPRA